MEYKNRYGYRREVRSRRRLEPGEHIQESAKDAMQALLGKMGFDHKKYALFEIWDKETKGLIRGCTAVAIQGTRLCVEVPSVVHRQELMYSKDRLIKKINQAMGKEFITDIKFELQKGGTLRVDNPRRGWNWSFGKRHE